MYKVNKIYFHSRNIELNIQSEKNQSDIMYK